MASGVPKYQSFSKTPPHFGHGDPQPAKVGRPRVRSVSFSTGGPRERPSSPPHPMKQDHAVVPNSRPRRPSEGTPEPEPTPMKAGHSIPTTGTSTPLPGE